MKIYTQIATVVGVKDLLHQIVKSTIIKHNII
jgi:hypothetical protein